MSITLCILRLLPPQILAEAAVRECVSKGLFRTVQTLLELSSQLFDWSR